MLISATGMFHMEHDAQPAAFSSIPASMWWAFATLTTVGYGDITPITTGGKMFGALITVVGVGMVALPTGILASAYTDQLRRRSETYRRQTDIAFQDGVLTTTEAQDLEQLRQTLGLAKSRANQIVATERERMSQASKAHRCPLCGTNFDAR